MLVVFLKAGALCTFGCGRRSKKPERLSPPGYSKKDYGQYLFSQEWKSGAAAHDRSGKPGKTSWDMMQKDAPHREEPLLGGNANPQSTER